MSERRITIDDLFRITDIAQISADDAVDRVAVVTATPDERRDATARELWAGTLDGGLERVPAGAGAELASVSGDGGTLAWTRSSGEGYELLVAAGPGEPRAIPLPARCRAVRLSPDGRVAAVALATKSDEGWNPRGYYRYRGLRFKSDAEGYWDGTVAGLYLLDVRDANAAPEAIDASPTGDRLWPAWSPDGSRLAYVRSEPRRDKRMNRMSLWVHDRATGENHEVLAGPGPVQHPAWSPDGSRLAFAGHDDPRGGFHVPWDVIVTGLDGRRENLTLGARGAGDRILGDLAASTGWASGPVWTTAGVLFLGDERGSGRVFRVRAPGEVEALTPAGRHVAAFAASRDGARVVVKSSTATRLPALTAFTGAAFEERPVPGAAWNDALQADLELSEPSRHEIRAGDGATIDAWVLRPPGGSSAPGPAVVEIHGGPHASYGETFFHEFQWLAASGYTVFYCNPRGSLGYAPDFTGGISGAWGVRDASDVMTAVDWFTARSGVDAARVAVTGGSYGGFMTNWLVAHTNRFRAAVTDRSLSNNASFYGTSEIGPFFSDVSFAGDPWSNPDEYRRSSPITYADRITTPLLILHGAMDAQTPVEQAEQLFVALATRDRDVELVVFPGANHELSRAGKPSQRRARLELMREWFDRHLGVTRDEGTA